jgi:hypothetical protein
VGVRVFVLVGDDVGDVEGLGVAVADSDPADGLRQALSSVPRTMVENNNEAVRFIDVYFTLIETGQAPALQR